MKIKPYAKNLSILLLTTLLTGCSLQNNTTVPIVALGGGESCQTEAYAAYSGKSL